MDIFSEISILIVIATLVSLLMRKLKQPLIIGHIITGLIVGPAMFGLISNAHSLETFSKFGTVLLLFVVGIGLNPRIIKEVGKVSLVTGLGQVIFTSAIGFVLVLALGFNVITAIFISIALTFSSTIIILKLLMDKRDQNKLYGKISIGFLLVQDIVATFALIVVSATGQGNFSFQSLLIMIGKLLVLSLGIYLFSKFIIKKINKFLSRSTEMLFLFAIAWGLGIAALTSHFGFSIEAGALFAGVMLAGMPYAQEVSSRLKPLRDFFIVIFFITLGSSLSIAGMQEVILPTIILSIFVLVGNPLIVFILMNLLGYTKKTGFKAGLTVAQVSEFSIIFILLGKSSGQISGSAVYLVTSVALITIAASTYMVSYSDKLYDFLSSKFSFFRDKNIRHELGGRPNYSAVLFGYKKGGHDFLKLFQEMKKKYIVIDYDPETIEILENNNITHMYGDAQDPELMDEIGLDSVKIMISNITEFETNLFLTKLMARVNPNAIIIVYAETVSQLEQLYTEGASYVMMPHYIGSEQMRSFIRRKGFDKNEFNKMRDKHLLKIKSQIID